MNAKELRIGNLTYYTNPHSDMIVQEVLTPKDLDYAFSLDPIPLTEEWLLNFGFEKVEDLGDMIYYQIINKRRGFGVELNHDEWVFYLYNNIDYTPLIYNEPHFKYVHQLQNLYFALTGKELTQELT